MNDTVREGTGSISVLDPPFGTLKPTALQAALIALARATPLKRGEGRKLVAKLLAVLRPGPVDVETGGVKFRLHLDGSPTEWAMLLNPGYNAVELARISGAVAGGGVFVDIGANVGLYSLTVAARAPAARVIAIEPGPVALARLRDNLAAGGQPNVAIAPLAVGEAHGELRFDQDSVNLGHSRVSETGSIVAPVCTLAGLLADLGLSAIAAMKIDVEGFEDKVLFPFFETWPEAGRPEVVVIEHSEQSGWARDCLALLTDMGYRLTWKGRGNSVYERARHEAAP